MAAGENLRHAWPAVPWKIEGSLDNLNPGEKAVDQTRRTPYRIAVGGIFTECNDFGGLPIDVAAFERTELVRGKEMLTLDSGVVGGMLDILRVQQQETLPLLYASASPGGPLTAECYSLLKEQLIAALEVSLPVDGVLLPLHGSAAVENVDDLEGDLIQAVRAIVGYSVPVVVTLDLHASVTAAMVLHSDALLGWETYPHRDSFTTGQRGARMLLQILDGSTTPVMAMGKVPVVTGAVHTSTEGAGPFGDIMRRAKSQEGEGSVISTSVFLVHPHLDRPEMGSGALVITNNDVETAVTLANDLAEEYWRRRFEIEPPLLSAEAAVKRGLQTEGRPVILVEAADCCGGGAAGDSVATLRALIDGAINEESLVPVVDPRAAAICHQAGIGEQVTLPLGHSLDPRWGTALEVTGRVDYLSDGRFSYQGGVWEGLEAEMGPSAVLSIGSIRVLITTYATYEWRDEQFRSVGLDPQTSKFVVAKNPMNHVMTYGDIASEILVLDTPGPTPATCLGLTYVRVKRPFYPFDRDIPGLKPTILRSRDSAPKGHQ